MSNIQFRAYEKPDNNRFVKDYSGFLGAMHYGDDVLFYLHKWVNNPDYEIMQYTGLRDGFGKEMYEGDIVEGIAYGEPRIGIIKWSNDGLWIIEGNSIQDYYFPAFKVIGNLYENPSLLHDSIIKNLQF